MYILCYTGSGSYNLLAAQVETKKETQETTLQVLYYCLL